MTFRRDAEEGLAWATPWSRVLQRGQESWNPPPRAASLLPPPCVSVPSSSPRLLLLSHSVSLGLNSGTTMAARRHPLFLSFPTCQPPTLPCSRGGVTQEPMRTPLWRCCKLSLGPSWHLPFGTGFLAKFLHSFSLRRRTHQACRQNHANFSPHSATWELCDSGQVTTLLCSCDLGE